MKIEDLGVRYLLVDARVRYWEDAEINGESDESGKTVPFKFGDSWKPTIDLKEGKIKDWPDGVYADIHFKVCDDGDYWLADDDLKILAKWKDYYVPDDFLAMESEGYGDYIILILHKDGRINNWKAPVINRKAWNFTALYDEQ